MKQDKLETYIRQHREDFDELTPPAAAWEKITARLAAPKSGRKRQVYWQVAAVLFFVLSLGLLLKNMQPVGHSTGIDPEFSATEQYYRQIIQEKENLLAAYLARYPELAEDFTSDLQELNENYQMLKADFEQTHSPKVLNALILNLQLQQDLLLNQLKIIQLIEKENTNVSI